MSLMSRAVPPVSNQPDTLKTGLDVALAFTPARVAEMAPPLPIARIKELTEEEASFGRVTVDARGLTPGSKINVVEPWRAILSAWYAARNQFDQALAPKMADIRAVAKLTEDIEERKKKGEQESERAEQEWQTNEQHKTITEDRDRAKERWDIFSAKHDHKAPMMFAYRRIYKIALLCIGVAEWLINYDTFLLFLGVPAIAAGATLILGVLLAFAAHGHGELFKQWPYRFGADQERMKRTSSYRLFALSTLGLAIVLMAAGGSRYAAALNTLVGQPVQNILGGAAIIDVDPLRDVLISLLANLGAWAVGVFISYYCHDVDPEFMDAKHDYDEKNRRWIAARRKVNDAQRTIVAKTTTEIRGMELLAKSRAASVATEQAMLEQVEKQEAAIIETITSGLRAKAEQYRDALAQVALAARGGVAISRVADGEDKILSPFEYRALPILIDSDFLKDLMR